MARTILVVEHDDTLVGANFMADHIAELEGVTDVEITEDAEDHIVQPAGSMVAGSHGCTDASGRMHWTRSGRSDHTCGD